MSTQTEAMAHVILAFIETPEGPQMVTLKNRFGESLSVGDVRELLARVESGEPLPECPGTLALRAAFNLG